MVDSNYPGLDTIHRQELSNGITLLVYENFASASIVIEGMIRAGGLAISRPQAGLASFASACLMRGTEMRSFEQIYEDMESVGAALGFSGGDHSTSFSAHGLVEDIDLVLELLAQSLRQPTFPAAQVEQVRGQIMTGLHMRANNTRQTASVAFNELLYQDHPYGLSTQGYLETIPNISREDLTTFHHNYYGPRGMIITLVGAITADQALTKVESVFGDWLRPQQISLPEVPDASRPDCLIRVEKEMPEKIQSDIILGLPGPRRSAPDYLKASLMNTILGVFGMYGRIGKSVREEQGLAYYAYSRLQGSLGPAPWYACAGVAPDKVEQAISSIQEEIRRIQDEPVSEEELADSQAYRTGSMPVSLETNSGLANVITDMEFYDLELDYLHRFPDMINEITTAEIQAAAQKYLSADQVAVAVAGPGLNGA